MVEKIRGKKSTLYKKVTFLLSVSTGFLAGFSVCACSRLGPEPRLQFLKRRSFPIDLAPNGKDTITAMSIHEQGGHTQNNLWRSIAGTESLTHFLDV